MACEPETISSGGAAFRTRTPYKSVNCSPKISEERLNCEQTATDHFESMIASEAKRLQDEGKDGLILLPGVNDLLGVVSAIICFPTLRSDRLSCNNRLLLSGL